MKKTYLKLIISLVTSIMCLSSFGCMEAIMIADKIARDKAAKSAGYDLWESHPAFLTKEESEKNKVKSLIQKTTMYNNAGSPRKPFQNFYQEYNLKGNMIKSEFSIPGQGFYEYKYNYNDNNKISKVVYSISLGLKPKYALEGYVLFLYDVDDLPIKKEFLSNSQSLISQIGYKYNENKDLEEVTERDKQGKVRKQTSFTYDDKSKLIKKILFTEKDNKVLKQETYEYANSKLTKKITSNIDLNYYSIVEFNDLEKPIKQINYNIIDGNKRDSTELTFNYDIEGNLIESSITFKGKIIEQLVEYSEGHIQSIKKNTYKIKDGNKKIQLGEKSIFEYSENGLIKRQVDYTEDNKIKNTLTYEYTFFEN